MIAPITFLLNVPLHSQICFSLQSDRFLLEKLPAASLIKVTKYLIGDQTPIFFFKLAVPPSPFQISPTYA